ncbi:hypothetical protein [Klebsiella phage phiKp_21]|nr:hypothetical protein [Klebsiella phage phiKp_21]
MTEKKTPTNNIIYKEIDASKIYNSYHKVLPSLPDERINELRVLIYLCTEMQDEIVEAWINELKSNICEKVNISTVEIRHNRSYNRFDLINITPGSTKKCDVNFNTIEEAVQYCHDNNLKLDYL